VSESDWDEFDAAAVCWLDEEGWATKYWIHINPDVKERLKRIEEKVDAILKALKPQPADVTRVTPESSRKPKARDPTPGSRTDRGIWKNDRYWPP